MRNANHCSRDSIAMRSTVTGAQAPFWQCGKDEESAAANLSAALLQRPPLVAMFVMGEM
jgi:hypothetical protein